VKGAWYALGVGVQAQQDMESLADLASTATEQVSGLASRFLVRPSPTPTHTVGIAVEVQSLAAHLGGSPRVSRCWFLQGFGIFPCVSLDLWSDLG
jgi:hypothetical protein